MKENDSSSAAAAGHSSRACDCVQLNTTQCSLLKQRTNIGLTAAARFDSTTRASFHPSQLPALVPVLVRPNHTTGEQHKLCLNSSASSTSSPLTTLCHHGRRQHSEADRGKEEATGGAQTEAPTTTTETRRWSRISHFHLLPHLPLHLHSLNTPSTVLVIRPPHRPAQH